MREWFRCFIRHHFLKPITISFNKGQDTLSLIFSNRSTLKLILESKGTTSEVELKSNSRFHCNKRTHIDLSNKFGSVCENKFEQISSLIKAYKKGDKDRVVRTLEQELKEIINAAI